MASPLKTFTTNVAKIVSSVNYNKMYLYGYKMQKLAELFKLHNPTIKVLSPNQEEYTQDLYDNDIEYIYRFYKHPLLIHRMSNYDSVNRTAYNYIK